MYNMQRSYLLIAISEMVELLSNFIFPLGDSPRSDSEPAMLVSRISATT